MKTQLTSKNAKKILKFLADKQDDKLQSNNNAESTDRKRSGDSNAAPTNK
jgi:hypothetical protein